MKSSIIDVPRQPQEDDLFGIQVYQNALIRYIQLTDPPITISLQGEWGSGITSLMNQLRYNLCEVDNAPYLPVWINTWQYSLMHTPSQTIMAILNGIIGQIGEVSANDKWVESKKKLGSIFKTMATVGTKVAMDTIGVDSSAIEELFKTSTGESSIMQLKNEIATLIDNALAQNPSKKGFIMFIDDLDRIDPPVAVEILELLKNIFDLKYCVFVLAIDYDVVIKGLKPKFGELTDSNEREFRSFFDKIIQLPFTMPVTSYKVDNFLIEALKSIDLFTDAQLKDNSLTQDLSEIALLSVGSNPRSLKRLTNTLALISIINESQGHAANSQNTQDKLLNFALVCIQISYPYIYNQLTEEPNFKQWDESIAARLKLRPLTEAEKNSLDATEEFDEDWEKVLFRMCQKEIYLSNHVFSISALLNKIAEIINDDDKLGDIVTAIIELSAITNIKASETASAKKPYKFDRDLSDYSFMGKVYSMKTKLVTDVVLHHISLHPDITLAQLREDFKIRKNMDAVFMTFEDYEKGMKEHPKSMFFRRNRTLADTIKLVDANFLICSNWPTTSNGKPAEFTAFLEVADKLGYKITKS